MKRRALVLALLALTVAVCVPAEALARGRRGNTGRGGSWRNGGRQNRILHATTSGVAVRLGDKNPNIKAPIGSQENLQQLHDQAMRSADKGQIAPLADPSLLDAIQRAAESSRLEKTQMLNLGR